MPHPLVPPFIPVSPSLDYFTVRLEASTAPLLQPLGRCVAARQEWRREEFPNSKLLTLRVNAAEPAAPGSGNIAPFPLFMASLLMCPICYLTVWFKNYGGQGSRRIFFNLYFNINAIPDMIEIRECCFILFILHHDEIRASVDSSTRLRKGGAARGVWEGQIFFDGNEQGSSVAVLNRSVGSPPALCLRIDPTDNVIQEYLF